MENGLSHRTSRPTHAVAALVLAGAGCEAPPWAEFCAEVECVEISDMAETFDNQEPFGFLGRSIAVFPTGPGERDEVFVGAPDGVSLHGQVEWLGFEGRFEEMSFERLGVLRDVEWEGRYYGDSLAISRLGDATPIVVIGGGETSRCGDQAGSAALVRPPFSQDALIEQIAASTWCISEWGNVAAGQAVSGLGDQDSDGVDEVVVGVPSIDPDPNGGLFPEGGSAFVLPADMTGETGMEAATAHVHLEEQIYARFGNAVADAGDVTGDGLSDLIVGGFEYQDRRGGAWLFASPVVGSHSTAEAAAAFIGAEPGDSVGQGVDGVGDVDLDGTPDVYVSAQFEESAGFRSGRGRILSGAAWLAGDPDPVIATFDADVELAWMGVEVAPWRDPDTGDLRGLWVAAPHQDGMPGRVFLFEDVRGTLTPHDATLTLIGGQGGDRAGIALDMTGDLDGDGLLDLVVGAPDHDDGDNMTGSGRVYVVTGAGLAEILGDPVPDEFP